MNISALWARSKTSIAIRFILVVSSMVIILELMLGAYQVYRSYTNVSGDLENQITVHTDFLASVTVEHILTNNFFVLERLVRQTTANPNIVYAVILNKDGDALTRYVHPDDPLIAQAIEGGAPLEFPALFDAVHSYSSLVEEKRQVIESEGTEIGEVWLGYSVGIVRQRLIADSLATMVITMVAIVLLAGLTYLLFNWLIARPLQDVRTMAARFAAGNLKERSPIKSPNEIGQLKSAFNQMAEQLESTLEGFRQARDQAEEINEKLRLSEAEARKLSQVASRTSNLVIITDPEGTIEWANDSFVRSSGYTLDEIMGRRPGELLQGPESDQSVVEYMRQQLRNQQPFHAELINYTKDKKPYWVTIDAQPVYDDSGTVTSFIAVERDITERKQMDKVLHQRVELDQLIADVSAQFVNCPANQVNIQIQNVLQPLANKLEAEFAVMALLDEEVQNTLQIKSVWFDEIYRSALHPYNTLTFDYAATWCQTLQSGKPLIVDDVESAVGGYELLTHYKADDGFRSLLIMPILWGGSCRGHLTIATLNAQKQWSPEVVGAMEIVSDLFASALERMEFDLHLDSERRALHRRTADLDTANAALAEASRAKDAFWASMSHELRTPLNAILGFAQLMARSNEVTDVQKQHLDVIQNSGGHLLGLINDVLSLAKIEAGRMTITPTNFDLYRLLNGIEQMFRERIEKKGLQFAIIRKNEIPQFVNTDQGKLRQVLINLVDNATKFTDTGSIILRVSYYERESRLGFAIEDTGMGIAKKDLDSLFDLFTQTESGKNSQGGTGLGLAISRQFVNLMGGDMTVKSQPNKGTTFSFTVDVTLVTGIELEELDRVERIVGLAPNQKPCHILAVEDLEDNQILLREILQEIGFEIDFANNGEEGVMMAKMLSPDLILMDLAMPVMDGYEATRQIRKLDGFQNVPIIAVTASALEHQNAMALEAGCNKVLNKPIQFEQLLTTIAQYSGVEYIYDNLITSDSQSTGQIALASNLADLPVELQESLYIAATNLDTDTLYGLCGIVREINIDTGNLLHGLIDDFDLEAIIKYTTAYEPTNAN